MTSLMQDTNLLLNVSLFRQRTIYLKTHFKKKKTFWYCNKSFQSHEIELHLTDSTDWPPMSKNIDMLWQTSLRCAFCRQHYLFSKFCVFHQSFLHFPSLSPSFVFSYKNQVLWHVKSGTCNHWSRTALNIELDRDPRSVATASSQRRWRPQRDWARTKQTLSSSFVRNVRPSVILCQSSRSNFIYWRVCFSESISEDYRIIESLWSEPWCSYVNIYIYIYIYGQNKNWSTSRMRSFEEEYLSRECTE